MHTESENSYLKSVGICLRWSNYVIIQLQIVTNKKMTLRNKYPSKSKIKLFRSMYTESENYLKSVGICLRWSDYVIIPLQVVSHNDETLCPENKYPSKAIIS